MILTISFVAHGLLQILKAALFGPKSIQATRKSGHLLTRRKTYAQIWGVTTLTPGAVAWAVTVVSVAALANVFTNSKCTLHSFFSSSRPISPFSETG
jgi:hypothetical protein